MTAIPTDAWPSATLDGVRRLRVLDAVLPGVQLVERDLAHSFEKVWAAVSDLERSVPRFDREVSRLRVISREGTHLRIVARTRQGLRVPFRVELEPGFMWMQAPARAYVVGMAATPLDEWRTRLAHLEGIPYRVGDVIARTTARHVEADVDGVVRLLDDET
jgi:hypothetical protein